MEKLWSPWRSQYIESFKDKTGSEGCIFCNAVDQKIADQNSLKVLDQKLTMVMLNLFPYNNGHLMIVPKRHLSNFIELTDEELTEINRTTKLSLKALEILMKPHGFNYGANLGKAAGAGIDQHLHFHIVPRWNGDTNFMPVLGDVKVISQDLSITKANLIEQYSLLMK
jgi:ATP adenylyltransferase